MREADERDDGFIPGSMHLPYRNARQAAENGLCGERPIVTICESGPRAAIAASVLHAAGLDARPVLDGGIARVAGARRRDDDVPPLRQLVAVPRRAAMQPLRATARSASPRAQRGALGLLMMRPLLRAVEHERLLELAVRLARRPLDQLLRREEAHDRLVLGTRVRVEVGGVRRRALRRRASQRHMRPRLGEASPTRSASLGAAVRDERRRSVAPGEGARSDARSAGMNDSR